MSEWCNDVMYKALSDEVREKEDKRQGLIVPKGLSVPTISEIMDELEKERSKSRCSIERDIEKVQFPSREWRAKNVCTRKD